MKVLVTSDGLLSTALRKISTDFTFVDRGVWDLTQWKKTKLLMEVYQPDVIINTAAKVGGVKLNSEHQEEMFFDNIAINANVIHAAIQYKVKKIICFGSTCTFDERLESLIEDATQVGEPYFNNFGYAYAKRMVEVHLRAAKEQYDTKYTYFIPCTLFGPCDRFNLDEAHVIPSLIHKCYLAKKNGTPLKVWGDGSPKRELLFSEDMAHIIVNTLDQDVGSVMVSSGEEVSVKTMVERIVEAMDFRGEVVWEREEFVSQIRRPTCDTTKLDTLGKFMFTPFKEGIKKTVDWFVKNYDSARK